MDKYKRINGHGHLLPSPEQIPKFMKEKEIFWLDDDRQFMYQKNWKRPVTDPSFFVEEKLAWMEQNKIDHEVILNLSQLYANGYDRATAKDIIRFQNNFNAGVQMAHPDKFTSGFVVQAAYVDDALEEIERCVERLDLSLLCLPTHFLDTESNWTSVADESVEPIFELANKYELALEIHPYDMPKIINLKDRFWRFHLIWMCAQTADTHHFYTLLNYHNKYPKLRVCFAHGNQYGQINTGRRKQGFEGRPDLFKDAVHPSKANGSSNLYFDTLVHDVYSFNLLLQRQGIGQIVAGLDDPYPLGEMENVGQSYPGKVIDDAVAHQFITDSERGQIWYTNVMKWLCPDTDSAIWNRILKTN